MDNPRKQIAYFIFCSDDVDIEEKPFDKTSAASKAATAATTVGATAVTALPAHKPAEKQRFVIHNIVSQKTIESSNLTNLANSWK